MLTKSQGSSASSVVTRVVTARPGYSYPLEVTNTLKIDDRNIITYDEGPMHNADWSMRWKKCQHTWYCGTSGVLTYRHHLDRWQGLYTHYVPEYFQQMAPQLRRWQSVSMPSDDALLANVVDEFQGRLRGTELPLTDVYQLYSSVKKSGNPAKDLVQPFHDLFRRKPKNLRDLIKKVTGADLAWKFGLVPMVKTVFGILNAAHVVDAHLSKLNARELSNQLNFSVTATPHDEVHATGSAIFTDVQGYTRVNASYTHRTRMTTKVYFRTTVDYDTSDSIRTKLLWDAYGISNIFGTVWDILPYSFVIDWFTNIGEVVDQMDTYLFHTSPLVRLGKLTDVWASITRRTSYEITNFKPVRSSNISYTSTMNNPGLMTLSSGQYVRRPLSPGSVGSVLPNLTVGGQPLTCAQTVTGLELLVQRVL